MHVVDNLQGIDVSLCKPAHHILELRHKFIVLKIFASDWLKVWTYLLARNLISTTVDSVEQALCKVCARTEELHLLANLHRRNAAGNSIVIAIVRTHKVVVLILDCRSLDRHLCAVVLPVLWSCVEPQNGKVWLWSRTEVLESVQETVACLCYKRTTVYASTTERLGYPNRVAREKVVIFRCAEETHDSEFDDELVYKFLSLSLGESALLDVALDEDIEERRDTAERHCCAVLILNRAKISEVDELNGLASILRRASYVEAVVGTHLHEILQGSNLLRCLLALLDALLCHFLNVETIKVTFALIYQIINSVESNTTIVADDSATTVGIRKTSDNV